MGSYGFTFGELDTSSANDGYGGLLVKFLQDVGSYSAGEKKPILLFDVRSGNTPISWDSITSPLQVNGNGLAINKSSAALVSLDISGEDAVRIPIGTTANRPSTLSGYIRYNSTLNQFEGCDGTNWNTLITANVAVGEGGTGITSYSAGEILVGSGVSGGLTKITLSAGTGIALNSGEISVDAAQTQITSVGTLSSLNITGDLEVAAATGIIKAVTMKDPDQPLCYLNFWDDISTTVSAHTNLYTSASNGSWIAQTNSSDRMTILNSGYVGIGTESPTACLQIKESGHSGSSLKTYGTVYMYGYNTQYCNIGYGEPFRKILLQVDNTGGSTDSQIYFIKDSTWKSFDGISSDSRIKQNQVDFPTIDSLNIVKTIKVKEYYNIEKQETVKGFIAQEVKEILPEAVTVDDLSESGKESDFHFLDYRRLQVHAFGAIQHLSNDIDTLKTEKSVLETKVTTLEAQVSSLLARVTALETV